ncbi:MAG: hypothetical protein KTR16_01670 [Acidiferrobacterales bacterium]|nr:hypothetical protein [Acidiferrobacterales bacterium]
MNTLSRSLEIGGHCIQTTASIGISVYPLDGDEFYLVYQPQFDLASKRLVGL